MVFLITLALLWVVSVAIRILFWTYIWQLKEYRFDRLVAEFHGRRFVDLLFPRPAWVKAVLFLAGAVLGMFFAPSPLQFVGWIVAAFYLIEGVRYLVLRTLRRSVPTVKALLIVGVAFLFLFGALVGSMYIAGVTPTASVARLGVTLTLLLADLAVPFFVFLAVLAMKVPTWVVRGYLLRKARLHRARFENLLVIGITGSFGKTSTKEFLGTMLSERFRVAKVPDHINSEIALARFIINNVNETHEVLITEMGAYKRGEIRRLARMVQPQIGILTGINEQHIVLFGGIEGTKKAKNELIESLPEKGLALFNADSLGSRELYEACDRPKRLYSAQGEPVDYYAEDVRTEPAEEEGAPDLLVFQVKSPDESRTFKVSLFGSHHVPNILAATAAAAEMGMSLEEIRDRAQYLEAPAHTMQVRSGLGGCIIIDDTYSANPTGVAAALESLKSFGEGKKVLIMPSLIELGATSERLHEEIGVQIGGICDLAIITTFDGFLALQRGVGAVEKIAFENDPKKILDIINRETTAGDVILLESRVPEMIRNALIKSEALNPKS